MHEMKSSMYTSRTYRSAFVVRQSLTSLSDAPAQLSNLCFGRDPIDVSMYSTALSLAFSDVTQLVL